MLTKHEFEQLLSGVRKPGRYIGGELYSVKKDLKDKLKFALCFPDLYEIGMSHLGLRILYGLLNAESHIACERVFAPATDFAKNLRAQGIELFTLESQTSIKQFDIVGFSLEYEMNYPNVLEILDLGGIPVYARERNSHFPLVIAGGPCCANPEPLAEFVDLFVLGEAEEVILEICRVFKEFKNKPTGRSKDKNKLLLALAQIKGVYVPNLYQVNYDQKGRVEAVLPKHSLVPAKIHKRIVKNLDQAFFPTRHPISYIEIVHDRMILEIMRGCPFKCNFCQSWAIYSPPRRRNIQRIYALAKEGLLNSGYDEVSLLALSSGSYPGIEKLMARIIAFGKDKAIGVTLPSLRAAQATLKLPAILARVRKSTLTFAPEVASPKMHKIINKCINYTQLANCILEALKCGWRKIKLYFMVALPNETNEDLDAIAELLFRLSQVRLPAEKKGVQINVSVNAFIPKPQTPLQWAAMQDRETIHQKYSYLKNKVITRFKTHRHRTPYLAFHSPELSVIEAAISRGDRRLNKVIWDVWKQRQDLEFGPQTFDLAFWHNAFKSNKLELNSYLRKREPGETLPWEHLDFAVSRQKLLAAYRKAKLSP